MRSLGIAVVLALAAFGGVRSGAADEARAAAVCKGAAWCGWHSVKVNGVLVSCHQYNCRTHGRVEHSESH